MAQEAVIRKNLAVRLPNLPSIDEVSKTPMPGLYEVRINQSDIYYTDAKGDFLIQGSLIDTKAKVDLTEQRVNKLSAISFSDLPLKDASPSCAAKASASWWSSKTPIAATASASSATWPRSTTSPFTCCSTPS